MAEIDPVILELRAELGRYRADLKSTTSQVQRLLGDQERSVQRLEKQMLRSSTAISGALRTLGASLGTYFSGREIVGLVDNFTRLQNAIRVTGLEGAELERVQVALLDLSSRYGVSVNELANLYGKSAQAATDLGAGQAELLQISEASAQALKITGTNAVQAQGALLGLTQALASGVVRAEEFNQINEGGLRPLLQVAAASEKYGGSVAKLRMAVVDGKVTSQEFYQSILAGSAQLEGQASKATLTLAGAFEALTSRLTVYIGQSAEANGVTGALAGAMQLLAENLDTIIPALAIIGTALGGRLLAGALAGGTALRTLAAYASIATTSLAGTALAARSAGAALLAAFGGPVGLAITAVALGLAYVVTESNRADEATGQYKKSLDESKVASDKAREAAERLANAHGKTRAEALKAAQAERESTKQKLAGAKASLILAQAELKKATAFRAAQNVAASGSTGLPGTGLYIQGVGDKRVAQARANVSAEEQAIKNFEGAINSLTNMIEGSAPPSVAAVSDGKTTRRSGASGPSEADIARRFYDEINSLDQQALSARQALATSAEERADLEIRSVELARRNALESLKAEKDYSAEQKARIAERIDNIASLEAERIEREKRIRLAEEAADLAETSFRAQSDALRQQYDLAKSQTERRELAYEIIALEYQERDAALERIKNNKDLSDAVRQRAAIEQAALREAQGRTMESARRDTAGPLEKYFDGAKKTADELNEAYQELAVDGIRSVTDELANAGVEFLNLGGVAGRILNQIIADFIRLQALQAIGNGGGFLSRLFGFATAVAGASTGNSGTSLKAGFKTAGARAGGGPVQAGGIYRVNEIGQEFFQPASSGKIIPVGEMNRRAYSASSRPTIVQPIIQVDARGAVMNDQFAKQILSQANQNAVQVAGQIGKATLAAVPGRMASYQRDGT